MRQDENRHPKLWKSLNIDSDRKMASTKEYRGRCSGITPVTHTLWIEKCAMPKLSNNSQRTSPIDRSSSFYQRARSGFNYWKGTNDNYTPKNPVKTRYSFGDRFNPGRLGVKCDRVYTSGGTNYHYWSSVESKMTPIGGYVMLIFSLVFVPNWYYLKAN